MTNLVALPPSQPKDIDLKISCPAEKYGEQNIERTTRISSGSTAFNKSG